MGDESEKAQVSYIKGTYPTMGPPFMFPSNSDYQSKALFT